MPKNFYNLPPSWNPGYAIPESVMDEGLERRTFVTAQAPRGTFDNPKVGNHGYAVPQYVDEEGLGRGTFTTKMLPRGYYGPRVPNWLDQKFSRVVGTSSLPGGKGTVVAMQTMGDSDGGTRMGVFGTFGQRAAMAMIQQARRLPTKQAQAQALKAMMDKIDPSLYGRAGAAAAKFRERGASPQTALAQGIAAAMSEGILAELHQVGKSRTPPQARSLLGLGCYGCAAALGETATFMAPTVGTTVNVGKSGVAVGSKYTGGSGMVGTNPCAGYSWTGSAWAITRAGQPDIPGPPGSACPARRDHTIELTPTAVLVVGPFAMMSDGKRSTMPLTSEQTQFVAAEARRIGQQFASSGDITKVLTGERPIVKFTFPTSTNPNSGKKMGLFVNTKAAAGQPTYWFARHTPPAGFWSSVWDALSDAAVWVVDVVKDAVAAIGDMACGVVSAPGAAGAAAAASGGAAAVGVAIAGGLCGGKGGQPPPPAPAASSFPILPVALIGGAALLIVGMNKKKG